MPRTTSIAFSCVGVCVCEQSRRKEQSYSDIRTTACTTASVSAMLDIILRLVFMDLERQQPSDTERRLIVLRSTDNAETGANTALDSFEK